MTERPLVNKILDIVLEEHEAEVTSYDAGWLDGCVCGWYPTGADEDRWAQYRRHLGEKLMIMLDEPGALDE